MKNKLYNALLLPASTLIVAISSYSFIFPDSSATHLPTSLTLPAKEIIPPESSLIQQEETQPALNSLVHKIKPGESLSLIFAKLNLNKTDLHQIIHTNDLGKQFAVIAAHKELIAKTDADGELQQLIYPKNNIETLVASRENQGFKVELLTKDIETKVASVQTTINSSLFLDGKASGLTDKTIMQLADIFAWDIDFALNLKKGDQFNVVYEQKVIDNKVIDTGNILVAEFVNHGEVFTAVRFEDEHGHESYYTPEGKNMRKAFLRTPVDFARVSSHFNLKRKHPVLNRIRAHKGVDYAATTGTPIKATGDGRIIHRATKGGYGRTVVIQHGKKYSTLYAHLSKYKKGFKVGSHVKQGEVIGYVGSSGLATGPHLHYEFRINGRHTNPLTVKLPHAAPINGNLLATFKQQTKPLLALLNNSKASALLAHNQF